MKLTSAGEKLVSVILTASSGLSVWLGWPGAPGSTMGEASAVAVNTLVTDRAAPTKRNSFTYPDNDGIVISYESVVFNR